MKAIGADTKKQEVAPNAYLPGGVISALRGKAKLLIVEELVHKGRLGNWLAVKLSTYSKTIAIINMYRILALTSNRNKYSLTQYNLIDSKAKKPMQYRKEILTEIKKNMFKIATIQMRLFQLVTLIKIQHRMKFNNFSQNWVFRIFIINTIMLD